MKIYSGMICGLTLCVVPPVMAASHTKHAAGLSAAQIVSRNVEARGGLKAWRQVKNITMSGELEGGGKKNTDLPFVLRLKRPHKSRLEITFRNQKAVQVYDGAHGWKVRPFLGRSDVEPFSPKESQAAHDWQELDGPLVDYKHKGTHVKLEGMDTVEGHKTYKLLLTMKDGDKRHLWIDAKTFLERKIDGQRRKLDGKLRYVAVFYRDYHNDNGLKMPHIFETVVNGGKIPHKIHIEHVAINSAMDDGLFGKPQLAMAPAPQQGESGSSTQHQE